MLVAEGHALPRKQMIERFFAEPAEVSREYGVVVGGRCARILEMRDEGVCRSRRHRSAHVALVVDAEVHHFPERPAGDPYHVRAAVIFVRNGLLHRLRAQFCLDPARKSRKHAVFAERVAFAVPFALSFQALLPHIPHPFGKVPSVERVLLRGRASRPEHGAARSRHRPLRSGSALIAKLQRIAVLPLGRGKMAGCRTSHGVRRAAAYQRRTDEHPFAERGTGVVQPRERHFEISHREPRRTEFVQKVARKHEIDAVTLLAREAHRAPHRFAVHLALRLFVGALSPQVVRKHGVEERAESAVPLFGSHYGVGRAHIDRSFRPETLPSRLHTALTRKGG